MTLPTVVRRHRPIAYLLATVVGVATCLVASPGPAEAHIPPLTLCISVNEGDTRFQTFVDGTEDMIIWRCTKGREIAGFPPFYYWKHQIVSTDPVTELKKRAKSAVIRVFKEGVWQGSLQSGLAAFGQSDVDRAHIRYLRRRHLVDVRRHRLEGHQLAEVGVQCRVLQAHVQLQRNRAGVHPGPLHAGVDEYMVDEQLPRDRTGGCPATSSARLRPRPLCRSCPVPRSS